MEGELMVTLQVDGSRLDLRIPAFVPVGELIEIFGEALRIPVNENNRLQAEPLGRILDNEKTLQEEEVMHGSILTLI